MNLKDAKTAMLNYVDLFGNTLLDYDQIEKSNSVNELKDIFDSHYNHLCDQANDAKNSLDRFRRSLDLEK